MRLARIAIVKAEQAAEALPEGSGFVMAKKFNCTLMLLANATEDNPTELELGTIDSETIPVFNTSSAAIEIGQILAVGQDVSAAGRWVTIGGSGGGGGNKVFVTPSGGIAKRDGITCSFAACVSWIINDSNDLVVEDPGADPFDVYNIFACNIAGNILITAKLVAGKWIADAEDYPNAGV